MQNSIIAGLFSILGTIVGWWLNNLSQKGKIQIYVKNASEKFTKRNENGFDDSCDKLDAMSYKFNVLLDIYNSSREISIMRNIDFIFEDKKRKIFCEVPLDVTNHVMNDIVIGRYKTVSIINVPPKSAINLAMHVYIEQKDENWNFLGDINKIKIRYYNNKNRPKTKVIYHRKNNDSRALTC